MGRHGPQDFPLHQGFAHQPKLVVLQIAQTAVDQLGGGRRGGARQVALFRQHDPGAASRQIPRNGRPIDAAADHQKVGCHLQRHASLPSFQRLLRPQACDIANARHFRRRNRKDRGQGPRGAPLAATDRDDRSRRTVSVTQTVRASKPFNVRGGRIDDRGQPAEVFARQGAPAKANLKRGAQVLHRPHQFRRRL